jgi:hypothetical protein
VKLRKLEHRSNMKKNYGITPEDYDRMLAVQGGVCALCGNPETKKYKGGLKRLSVDHNHDTRQVRELLCADCNVLVGFSRESIPLLEAVIAYLKKHGATDVHEIETSKVQTP